MLLRTWNPRLIGAAAVLALTALLMTSGCSAVQTSGQIMSSSTITTAAPLADALTGGQVGFATDWRRVWTQQAVWTRMALIGISENPSSTPFAVTRLARTSSDMASLLTPAYGTAKAQTFGNLMTTHLDTTIALMRALKAKDASGTASAEKSWYANAAELAIFLAQTNPSIDETATNNALKSYLVVTRQEAVDRLAGKYGADVGDFDAVEGQAVRLSDMLAAATIKQYPDKIR